MPKEISKRLAANRAIIARLSEVVERFPDWRFQQILQNIGISSRYGEDKWYEESDVTLQNMSTLTTEGR